MDLQTMSLEELKRLRKEVEKSIETYEARQMADARGKLEAYAKELGVKLEDVLDAPKMSAKKAPIAPKYRHPENLSLTWSGRGRKPTWFIEALDSGMSHDDLKI